MRKREEVKIGGFFLAREDFVPPPPPSPLPHKTRNQSSSAFPITSIDPVKRSTDKQLCNGVQSFPSLTFLKYKLSISYKFEQSYFELLIHNGTTDQNSMIEQLTTGSIKNERF